MTTGPAPFLNLKAINAAHRSELLAAITRVVDSGQYILGEEVQAFERQFASYCGVPHVIGVGNCLDALTLILRGYRELGRMSEGDEVIVPANTGPSPPCSSTGSGSPPRIWSRPARLGRVFPQRRGGTDDRVRGSRGRSDTLRRGDVAGAVISEAGRRSAAARAR